MNILVRLSGGIGNQLFQFNAGIFFARENSTDSIFLDCRFLSGYETGRAFELDFIIRHFPNVCVSFVSSGFPAWASRLRFGRLFDTSISSFAFITSSYKLRKSIGTSPRWLILDGYFQTPDLSIPHPDRQSLFGKVADEYSYLRRDLPLNASIPLVSVHIRRGDFVSSKAASAVFNTVSLAYYRAAVRSFPAGVRFLVFGDDLSITSEFADEICGINVASQGLTLQEEFILMSLCDHHIIANSTFSWWAAHLGHRDGKRVIAPRDWYVDTARSRNNPLLLPHFELLSSI